jgi:hypothetical protein
MSLALILQLLIFCVVQLLAQNGTQQQFNARTETRIEQLERHRDAIDGLQLERRLTRLESQMETNNWLVTSTFTSVIALVVTHIYQLLTSIKQRKAAQ